MSDTLLLVTGAAIGVLVTVTAVVVTFVVAVFKRMKGGKK